MKFRAPFRSRFMLQTAAALMIMFMAGSSWAGDVTIRPLIKAEYRMDSNYFLAHENERSVYTYLLQPGVDIGYEAAKSRVALSYTLDAYEFDDREDVVLPGQRSADGDDYIGHTLLLKGRYRAYKRLLLGIDESFRVTRDPAQSDILSNAIDREKFTINRVTPSLYYDFEPKFTVGLRYKNTATNYSSDDVEDSTLQTGIFDLIYNFNKTFSLDLEYAHDEMEYDRNTADYSGDQVKLILRKELRLVKLDVGAGYNSRSFDDDALADIDSPVAHATVTSTPELFPGSLRFQYKRNFNERGTGDSYYMADRFGLNLSYPIGQKMDIGFGGYFQTADYEDEDRTDDKYDISADLGYRFTDWLKLKLFGGFEGRDSNEDGRDYDNVYVGFNLGADYELN